jgi:hypothetical protein
MGVPSEAMAPHAAEETPITLTEEERRELNSKDLKSKKHCGTYCIGREIGNRTCGRHETPRHGVRNS